MRREHVEPHRTPCLALPIDAGPADLYSAAPLNTFGEPGRPMIRAAETGRMGRDTPWLYALYSVVFRRRMHTNSARKPYSRKGFQICIQCIQRIPTPPLFALSLLLGPEYMNTVNTSCRPERACLVSTGSHAMYSVDAGADDLYSAGLLNTFRGAARVWRRTPETGRKGCDTRLLYALYSVVFRRHLHTNSARKPYCRKGFRKCIQCIQHIPTPFVFRLSLLLGREYMNTPSTSGGPRASSVAGVHAAHSDRFVFSRSTEYGSTGRRNRAANAENGTNRPRHAPVVCIVFRCIQQASAYKFGSSALLP